MAGLIYMLCALTSLLCAVLLLRGYFRMREGGRLLLWSGLCFVGLAISNIFLVLDRLVFPEIDLSLVRLVSALVGMSLLLYGLIWEAD